MRRLAHLLGLIGINAVPGGGFLFGGWSATTAMLLYWWETFFGTILLMVLFAWYRRLTRGDQGAPSDAQYRTVRKNTLGTTMMFTVPQGYFIGAIALWISQEAHTPLFPDELWRGMAAVSAFAAFTFLVDLVHLRSRPFAWIKDTGGSGFSRMIVMQFTIVVGGIGFAMFGRPWAVFAVFVVCKLLLDLAFWASTLSARQAPAAVR